MKVTIIFLFLLSQIVFGYINIHPTTFDKRIDRGGSYQEFTLHNSKSEPIMYRIYSETDGENSLMADGMEIYPRSLILKPGETRKIQLHIAVDEKLPPGEYSAILGVRELPVYEKAKNGNVGVTILTDFRLVLNGYAGDIAPILKTENLKLIDEKDSESRDSLKLIGKIENIGKLRGRFEVFASSNFLGNLRIMAGEKLDFKDFDFSVRKDENFKKPEEIIIKDYESKKEVMKVKI